MNLNLKNPIVFFDLETTRVQVAKDRIVEISIFKVYPNGNKEIKTWLVNPTIPIPKETSEIHGISDEKVANEPTFKELAGEIKQIMEGCDLAGYNSNKFDIPLLAEEFLRVDVDFDFKKIKCVDVQNIFHKLEKRTLTAAYKFYCDKDLINAHSAEAESLATYEILEAQIKKYDILENNISFLSDFSKRGVNVDMAGFIIMNEDNHECFSFGKYKGKTVQSVLESNPGYFSWIQQADFPLYTKKILNELRLKNKFS